MSEQGKRLAVLTNSEASCFQECARKWHYRYKKLRRPRETSHALRFGTAMHLVLEAYHGGADWRSILSSEVQDIYDSAKIEAMMICYIAMNEQDVLNCTDVEKELTSPLINPETGSASRTFVYRGKLDAIVRRPGLWVCDHKTTSEDVSPGAPHLDTLRLRPQGLRYFLAAKANGIDVEGTVYNILRKPRIKPALATPVEKRRVNKDGSFHKSTRFDDESRAQFLSRCVQKIQEEPSAYLCRLWVRYSDSEIQDAQFDLWSVAKQMMDSTRFNRFPKNTNNCFKWGRPCEYWGVCTDRASIDDEFIFRTAKTQHEELSNV